LSFRLAAAHALNAPIKLGSAVRIAAVARAARATFGHGIVGRHRCIFVHRDCNRRRIHLRDPSANHMCRVSPIVEATAAQRVWM
jgi:hypothetical protein